MSDRAHRARVRETRLRELGYETYDAYLRSPAWRDVKDRYRASELPQVCMCGDAKVQLHHTTYDRVGQERLDDLIALCKDCHDAAHLLEQQGVIGLDLAGFYYDPVRAAENTLVEIVRKQKARKEFLAHDPALAEREARAAKRAERGRARRPWARDPETPAQADARRAKAAALAADKRQPNAPVGKHAARIDANRPVPGQPRAWQP